MFYFNNLPFSSWHALSFKNRMKFIVMKVSSTFLCNACIILNFKTWAIINNNLNKKLLMNPQEHLNKSTEKIFWKFWKYILLQKYKSSVYVCGKVEEITTTFMWILDIFTQLQKKCKIIQCGTKLTIWCLPKLVTKSFVVDNLLQNSFLILIKVYHH